MGWGEAGRGRERGVEDEDEVVRVPHLALVLSVHSAH